jgi:hypothetical protein
MEASSSMESQPNQFTVSCVYNVYTVHINSIKIVYTIDMYCIYSVYLVYSTYINCIYIEYKCLYSALRSGQPQQRQHCVWQGICLATPGNDACHHDIKGCYCGPDNRVACRTANTAVLLVHARLVQQCSLVWTRSMT